MIKYERYSFADLEEEGNLIIDAAQKKAKEILQLAFVEAEQLKKDAKAIGKSEGLANGLAEGKSQAVKDVEVRTSGLVDNLQNMLTSISLAKEKIIEEYKNNLLRLAITIAEKVIKERLSISIEEPLLGNLEEAMRLLAKREEVEIVLNKDDVDVLEEYIPGFQKMYMDLGKVTILADEKIMRGGCVIKTKEAVVDATIETQISEIAKKIFSTLP
jgi:flagellar assembly protein FliH